MAARALAALLQEACVAKAVPDLAASYASTCRISRTRAFVAAAPIITQLGRSKSHPPEA